MALAALLTAKGPGAIAAVKISGDDASDILSEIFTPAGPRKTLPQQGRYLLGKIADESGDLDQVLLACEGPDSYTVTCHGNYLVVELLLELLRCKGAEIISPEEMLALDVRRDTSATTIDVEAAIASIGAATLEGARLIAAQLKEPGLLPAARGWLTENDLSAVAEEAARALDNWPASKRLTGGIRALLLGEPNVGKSALLNAFAGRDAAIVTDARGTTRDYVTAVCKARRLHMELIDTAGLAVDICADLDRAAQERTRKLLDDADIILLVLDASSPAPAPAELLELICNKTAIAVLNKSDLPARFDSAALPQSLAPAVSVSAITAAGIPDLLDAIRRKLAVDRYDISAAAPFTARQAELLEKIAAAADLAAARTLISELINAPPGV